MMAATCGRLGLAVERCLNQTFLFAASTSQTPLVHTVRFRKPRWVPIAKSKEFYVRQPTPKIPEEIAELKIRYRLYRCEVESLREFLRKELSSQKQKLSIQLTQADKDNIRLMRGNLEAWNAHVAAVRNERQLQEQLEYEQTLQEILAKRDQEQKLQAEQALATLKEKEAVIASYIHLDQLDAAIEQLLDSRADYNFAITKSGEKLYGENPDRKNTITASKVNS